MTKEWVISLFDKSGHMVKPWAERGYKTLCVDRQHKMRRPKPGTLNVDLRTVGPLLVGLWDLGIRLDNIKMVFAFPECTHVTGSCAQDWKRVGKGLRALAGTIEQFATSTELVQLAGCDFLIENPAGAIRSHWRDWDFTFDPCDFTKYEPRDNYTKKTCAWVSEGFVMPEPARDESLGPPDDRIHKASSSVRGGRANFRSVTPMGFARACCEVNA